jgi:IclR family KDG regulon transcriptional repressor
MKTERSSRYITRSVGRALSILHQFTISESELSLSEISQRTGLHESTVYRLLSTLGAAGFVEHSPRSGGYLLGPAALSLGQAYLRHSNLHKLAETPLARLRDSTLETANLAILSGAEIIYLEKLPGLHPIGLLSSRIGDRAPAHCTALGKALLAYQPEGAVRQAVSGRLHSHTPHTITRISALVDELEKVRQAGFAVDEEEYQPGVVCVAAPVFDNVQEVVAAISASGPADRMRSEISHNHLIGDVIQAATEVSTRLGGEPARSAATPPALATGTARGRGVRARG